MGYLKKIRHKFYNTKLGKMCKDKLKYYRNKLKRYWRFESKYTIRRRDSLRYNPDEVFAVALNNISKKEKIKIAFLIEDMSTWSGDTLFNYFANDSRFDPYIIAIPFYNGTEETIKKAYIKIIEQVSLKGFKLVEGSDNWIRNKTWKECGSPDIICYGNPHVGAFPDEWKPISLPRSVITFYVPYGFMIADLVQSQFNNKYSHQLFWKIFCESAWSKRLFDKYSDIGNKNVVFSGYPKMDVFYQRTNEKKSKKKLIIYSPHHSISFEKCGLEQSTFKDNCWFMLEMAKKYSNETEWIFRPHPLLEKTCIITGFFTRYEWDKYIDSWKNLSNAHYQYSGEYIDTFLSCDAMINDSVSYMVEALYVHKPMLYLKSKMSSFNEIGELVEKQHYICNGDDFFEIEKFINMIINNEDYMALEREKFFSDYFDYYRINGKMASQFIYEYIRYAIS